MRSSLYPRVPQDWDEWEAPRNMNVPLPAVLVYRGSGLLRGDPLHLYIPHGVGNLVLLTLHSGCVPSRPTLVTPLKGYEKRRGAG